MPLKNTFGGFEVLTAVAMKSTIFWDEMLCNLKRVCRFGGTFRLHRQGGRVK
jgi:hypothetical protein